jgi:SAM-dependent methyltransferase
MRVPGWSRGDWPEVRGTGARLLAVAAVVLVACAHPRADVPDVRTPHDVVIAMLRLADVGRDDVVHDLGSGDGRIVIEAARAFGARAVGIEIDPRLVAASRENARRAGVEDRVAFLERDLFEADLRGATVVTLYLSPELNARLRPKLLRELRPGARIVSHDFPMGDWRPDRTVRVQGPDREHTLYLWSIPIR